MHSPLFKESLEALEEIKVFITKIRSRSQMTYMSSYALGDKAQEVGSGEHGFIIVTILGTPHTNAKDVCRNCKPWWSRSPS